MKKSFGILAPLSLFAVIALTGCSEPDSPVGLAESDVVEVEVPEMEAPARETFEDGVLTTSYMTLAITDYRVIQAGAEGNEWGDAPLLAIWYDTTKTDRTDRPVSPYASFLVNFVAHQDFDPNFENPLSMSVAPDESLLVTENVSLKPGGTVTNAVSYELTDTTTPVEIVAIRYGEEIGRMTLMLN